MISKSMWKFCVQKSVDLFISCLEKDGYEVFQDETSVIHINKQESDVEYCLKFNTYDDFVKYHKGTPKETVLPFIVFSYEHYSKESNYVFHRCDISYYKETFDTVFETSYLDFMNAIIKELFDIRDCKNV